MDEQQGPDDPMAGFGSVRHRLRYRLDNLLARGTPAAIAWLGFVTLLAILLSSLLLFLFDVSFAGSGDDSWFEDGWQSMLRVMDPGTMAADVGWGRRILALVVTIFGLLVAGTLIGIIAAGVEDRIETMRRGRSIVIESDHIVILGNSDRIPMLIDQMTVANERVGGRTIVVLTEGDPSAMLHDVANVVGDSRGSRLVYRSGDPTRRADLQLVRLHAANTVIVLAGDEGDVRAVMTTLAVGAELGGFERVPIVVELADPSVAEILQQACGDLVHPILPAQAAARTTAFAMRGSGMGRVVDELLDFRRCDLHVRDDIDAAGLRFCDLVLRYTNARPVGLMRADGDVELDPDPDTVVDAGDRLVVFADDRRPLSVLPADQAVTVERPTGRTLDAADPARPDRLLVVGWNDFGADVITDWWGLAPPHSTVEVVADAETAPTIALTLDGIDHTIAPMTSTTSLVERLHVEAADGDGGAVPFSTVLLLADEAAGADESDATALLRSALVERQVPPIFDRAC